MFLCYLALAKAGVIGTYSSAPSVSTVYSSLSAPVVTKTVSQYQSPISYTKTYSAPAPVYESVLTTHESNTKSLDGTQQNTYSKALDTAHSSLRKFDSRTTNDGAFYQPAVHSASIISQPQLTYNVGAPVVHNVASPVTYTTHAQAPTVAKTFSVPSINHVVAGSSGLAYASHQQVVQPVKITYSEAPQVSHMTFHGLGTSYSW